MGPQESPFKIPEACAAPIASLRSPLGEDGGARWDPRKSRGNDALPPAWPPLSVSPGGKPGAQGKGGGNVDNKVFNTILDLSGLRGRTSARGGGAPLK
jgi:hypothetical protein